MTAINIDGLGILVKANVSILEACKYIGINIPKFCYHENLSVAGNCRMCLVELQKTPKPIASCAMPIINNMFVYTFTPLIQKARENVLETLLINHPLDCPICDQGGECDLQDETRVFGIDVNRFFFTKRSVEDKNCGLVIKTIMTRCIHCTRCVRFSSEIAGVDFFGTINRGTNTEISNYIPKTFNSFLSGNIIDLCPVGALTAKSYAFKARPWELKSIETIDVTDGSGTAIYFNYKESEIVRVLPKVNKEVNQNWISDRIRFCFDSFSNSRLHSVYEQENKRNYNKIDCNFIIKKLKRRIKKENSSFLINNEIDMQSLLFLKKVGCFSKKRIKFLNIENTQKNNMYSNWSSNKMIDIKKSKNCFLFFVNIYVENLVINTALKVKYNQQKLNIFNFGNKFNSNFPISFCDVSIKSLINFFESKLEKASKLLIESSNALIVLGESLLNKFANQQYLIFFVKKIIRNSIMLNINMKCNTESFKLLNVKYNSTKTFKKRKFFISINLDDNLHIRKYLNGKQKNFWLNSHGSVMATKNKYIIPVLMNAEEKNVFLNLEQKPQKTSTISIKINNAKSTKFFLKYILKDMAAAKKKSNDFFCNYKSLSFLQEILKSLHFLKKMRNKMVTLFNSLLSMYENRYFLFYKYSIKSVLEDFFLTNRFCQNSLTMNKISMAYREENEKFYF
jgi:NADH-quinone oxidoreductase subunit G